MLRDEDGKDDQKSIKMILCKIVTIIMLRCTIEAYLNLRLAEASSWLGWGAGSSAWRWEAAASSGGRSATRGSSAAPWRRSSICCPSIKCHGAKNRHFEMNMTIFLPHWKPHIQPFLKMGCTDWWGLDMVLW